MIEANPSGRHRQRLSRELRPPVRGRKWRWLAALVVVTVVAAIVVAATDRPARAPARHSRSTVLSTTPDSYIGVYGQGVPASYSGVTSFASATGVQPKIVLYYSGWFEPFSSSFAKAAAEHGAVPLVQMNPTGISLASIASGKYDAYLRSYARAVRSYREPVILGFGHEMNGTWYSWDYKHTSPAVFVAAWRHIVTVFRANEARNVTWLWTINTRLPSPSIPPPAAWWPGSSYVTWVGIDGYYHKPSIQFATLFGPTITAVRLLTKDPILISETGAAPDAGQAEKIASLFAGIRSYGLLGFVWFNSIANRDYRITSRAAIAAFRRGAISYRLHVF